MIDPHLNVFRAYGGQLEFHENNLTRALVCTIRSSRQLAEAFVWRFVDPDVRLAEGDLPEWFLQQKPRGWSPTGYRKRYVLPISRSGRDPEPEIDLRELSQTDRRKLRRLLVETSYEMGLNRASKTRLAELYRVLNVMPDDPDGLDEELLERLNLSLILSEPREREQLRPDAWLLSSKEGKELALAIEAKTKGEQYRPQLVWYRDNFLGEGAKICPTTRWIDVALLLKQTTDHMPSDSKAKFLVDQFLDYLQDLGFGYPMLEVDMSALQDAGHVAQLVLKGIPEILAQVRQAVLLRAKNWGLRKDEISEIESHCFNKSNSLFHQFFVKAGKDWNMGLYFGLAQWAKASGTPFWVLVGTTADTIRQILEEAGWEYLGKSKHGSFYLSQIELQADAPTLEIEKLVSQLVHELKEKLNWLRDRTRN